MARMALDRVQRWMQAVVVHPGTVDEGIRSPGAAAEMATVEEVVRPSARLTPAERVGIYHGMYLGRMVEALETDYPALHRLLGADGFADLVRDYVQAHPSRSYTLNRLGDHFPEFIAKAPGLRRRGFCHDLGRLELAMSQVFDEEETPALTPEAIAAVPAGAWEGARLHPIAAFRLLAVGHAVNAYANGGDVRTTPARGRRPGGVAVYRRQYSVSCLDLTPPAHALLEALAAGATIGEAVAGVLAGSGRSRVTAEDLFRWFREWVAEGIFRQVSVEKVA